LLKAWQRRFGADTLVEIDIEEQIAVLRFPTPRPIDLVALEEATRSGGHTVVSAHLEAFGRVVDDRCATCDRERPFLVLEGSGQRFEIEGTPEKIVPSGVNRFRGMLPIDSTDHPRFVLESFGSD
jgi:hypothetical protein